MKTYSLPYGMTGVEIPTYDTLPPFTGSDKVEVTIGVSNWNRADVMEATLPSMIEQDFPIHNFEVIVVDDASDDGSQEVITDIIRRYPDSLVRAYFRNTSTTNNEHAPHNITIKQALGTVFIKGQADLVFSTNFVDVCYRHHNTTDKLFLNCYFAWSTGIKVEEEVEFLKIRENRKPEVVNNMRVPWIDAEGPEDALKDPCDSGGSCCTKWLQEMHGFNEEIFGHEVGDVELMCRLAHHGILFGLDKSHTAFHMHLKNPKKSLAPGQSRGPAFIPTKFTKNPNGWGNLTRKDKCIMTPAMAKRMGLM